MRGNRTNLAYQVQEQSGMEELVTAAKKTGKKKKKFCRLHCFFCVLYGAALIAGLLVKTAHITEQKSQLTAIQQEYEALLNENRKLEVHINSQIDLRKVEEFAIANLQMNKPKKSQVVYLGTYPKDYGEVLSYGEEDKTPKGLVDGILQSFTGIFAYSN